MFPRLAPHRVVGCGIQVPGGYDPEGFRARHRLDGRLLVYAGRREGAKRWEHLLESFARQLHDAMREPWTLITDRAPEDLVLPQTITIDRRDYEVLQALKALIEARVR